MYQSNAHNAVVKISERTQKQDSINAENATQYFIKIIGDVEWLNAQHAD